MIGESAAMLVHAQSHFCQAVRELDRAADCCLQLTKRTSGEVSALLDALAVDIQEWSARTEAKAFHLRLSEIAEKDRQ